MRFSIRRPVHFDDFDRWLSGLEGTPVELALPHDMQEFWSVVGRLNELKEYVHDNSILVSSVHAPHGRLSGNAFLSWAAPVMKLAQNVGASAVVFHPENHVAKARKPELQAVALSYIRTLQEAASVTAAIETFKSNSRLFTPQEIMEHNLPMVLDTSHVREQYTFDLIKEYSGSIAGVHLSESRIDPALSNNVLNHLPVEDFGFSVLRALKDVGWDGCVTLEYLPQYHDRLAPDRERLEEMFP